MSVLLKVSLDSALGWLQGGVFKNMDRGLSR